MELNELTHQKVVDQTGDRIQFLGVLVFFFPTLLSSLFSFAGEGSREANAAVLQWSLLIALFIFNYIVFEARKKFLVERMLTYINWSLFIGFWCFLYMILFFALIVTEGVGGGILFSPFIYTFVFYALIGAPIFNILVILATYVVDIISDIKMVRNKS